MAKKDSEIDAGIDEILDDEDFFNEVLDSKVQLTSSGRRWITLEQNQEGAQRLIDFMDKLCEKGGGSDKHGRRFDIPIGKLNLVLEKIGLQAGMIEVGQEKASQDVSGLNNSLNIMGYKNKKFGVRRNTAYKVAKYYSDYVEDQGGD